MEVVLIIPFGWCETMVLSRHRKRTWELDWTSGQILFRALPASTYLCSGAEVLTFRQNEMESIGVTWARFTLLIQIGPDFSLLEYMLLQHFYTGPDKESAHHLDITSGGSFAHLTATEWREILDKILNRTSFVCVHEPSLVEPKVRREEIESQSIDSTPEPCPELKPETPEEEDPQPLEFLHNFKEDLFEDYENTSNYSY